MASLYSKKVTYSNYSVLLRNKLSQQAVMTALYRQLYLRLYIRCGIPSGVNTAITQFFGLILMPYFRKFSIMSLMVVAANSTMIRFLNPAHRGVQPSLEPHARVRRTELLRACAWVLKVAQRGSTGNTTLMIYCVVWSRLKLHSMLRGIVRQVSSITMQLICTAKSSCLLLGSHCQSAVTKLPDRLHQAASQV